MYDLDKNLACSKHKDNEVKFKGTQNTVTKSVVMEEVVRAEINDHI